MKLQREQPVDANVLAFWRARSTLLDHMLGKAPTAEQSWFWQIQRDIVHYMLGRYSGAEVQPPASSEELAIIADVHEGLSPAILEVRQSALSATDAGMGKSPRASGKIRPILAGIAQGNQARYERLERIRVEAMEVLLLERARMLDSLSRSERVAPMRALLPEGAYADTPSAMVFEPPPEMVGVSDAEISDILAGKIFVEPVPDGAWEDDETNYPEPS